MHVQLRLHRTLHHGSIAAPPGASTRHPSFLTGAEPFASKERYSLWTLFYPDSQHLSMLVLRNQIPALAGNAPTVSLSGCTHPSARNAWSEIRVSSGSVRSIAEKEQRCKDFLRLRPARLSFPRLKPATSRRDLVKCATSADRIGPQVSFVDTFDTIR